MKDHGDERSKELEPILRFTALINSSLKIEDVLNYAMTCAEEFMDAEASTVYELDEEKNELFIRIARGEKKTPVERIRFELGQGISGHVVKSGQPMVIQDVRKEKRFSPKTHGAGLGLAVVYQIVKNHDGDIAIQSQEGKGTSVTIRLPVSQ